MARKSRSKSQALKEQYEEQVERLTLEAFEIARTIDVREVGPVLTAYGTIILWLDTQIQSLSGQTW